MRDPGSVSDGLTEPLPRALRAGLRDTLLALKARVRTRAFHPELALGVPGGKCVTFELSPADRYDHALRADIIGAMLHRARSVCPEQVCWLSRPGHPSLHDLDADWLAAARTAYAEAGAPLTMVIITKTGWFDPRTGVGQTWRRLRRR